MKNDCRVVITGLGAVCAVGIDVPSLWAALVGGKSGVNCISSFDASSFETRFAAENIPIMEVK